MTDHKPIALTDVFRVSPNQVASAVGEDLAILDLDHSIYYGLDAVGARIWELLQEPTPLTQVVSKLVSEFEVDEATASEDLLALVRELLDKQLVEVCASHVA